MSGLLGNESLCRSSVVARPLVIAFLAPAARGEADWFSLLAISYMRLIELIFIEGELMA